jgi:hypothetical protein
MLMWLMNEAKGVERSLEALARRLLFINVASIHITSLVRRCISQLSRLDHNLRVMQVLTQVLCRLVSSPEYIEPLRQEVEDVIAEEGWTKAGMDKMRKLDSFLRETQRIDDLFSGLFDSLNSSPVTDSVLQVVMCRLALRPFTFSNGVTIPAGTLVGAPLSGIHMDEDIYSNPRDFDGFRFSKLSDSNGDTAENKHQAVTTSPEHLAFGFGRSAW